MGFAKFIESVQWLVAFAACGLVFSYAGVLLLNNGANRWYVAITKIGTIASRFVFWGYWSYTMWGMIVRYAQTDSGYIVLPYIVPGSVIIAILLFLGRAETTVEQSSQIPPE